MSSDQKSRPGAQRSAVQKVVEAYQRCLEAREQYIAAMSASSDSGLKGRMHRQLHQTVFMYFEALNPYLRRRDVEVVDPERDEDYSDAWEEARLWTTSWKDVVDKEEYQDLKGEETVTVEKAMEWPNEGIVVVAKEDVVGLKKLENLFEQKQTERSDVENMFGSFERQTTKPQLLDIRALFRIARYLDQTAEAFGFLSTVEEPPTRTEITDDLIEEVEEWRQKNMQ